MVYRTNGDLVKKLMANRNMLRKDLAALADVTQSTITNFFNKGASRAVIKAVAAALEVGDYRILVRDEDRGFLDASPPVAEKVPFCMFHRIGPDTQRYYEGALSSDKEVIYLSIMSHNSFEMVKANLSPETKLKVLTWNPASVEEIYGFAKHEIAGFSPLSQGAAKVKQVQDALIDWDTVAKDYPNVTVHTYDSSPTMQGVVVIDGWAMIELIPFDSDTKIRPALLLRHTEQRERDAFGFFAGRFKKLLRSARRRVAGESSPWFL